MSTELKLWETGRRAGRSTRILINLRLPYHLQSLLINTIHWKKVPLLKMKLSALPVSVFLSALPDFIYLCLLSLEKHGICFRGVLFYAFMIYSNWILKLYRWVFHAIFLANGNIYKIYNIIHKKVHNPIIFWLSFPMDLFPKFRQILLLLLRLLQFLMPRS